MNRYAFSTAALYPLASETALEYIGKAGFRYAELMPQAFSDVDDDFAERALKTGVQVSSVHYPLAMFGMLYTSHPAMAEDGRVFSRKVVRLCQRLGAGILVVHPHVPSSPQYREILEEPVLKNLLYVADLCRENNITMAMENSPKGSGNTGQGLLGYIASLGPHPAIRPMVDTTEACEAFQDPVDFIKTVSPVLMHLSDHKGELKHLPAGQGGIDWNAVRDALIFTGFNGYYTLEPSYRYYLEDIENRLKDAYRFISSLIGGTNE